MQASYTQIFPSSSSESDFSMYNIPIVSGKLHQPMKNKSLSFLLSDSKFLVKLLKLASPIMLQQLIFSSLGMVDTLMIGQLGDSAVAAVGIANQVFFLVTLLYFGVTSGSAIFTAQYWGQKDIPRINQVLGLSLMISLAGGGIFALAALLAPAGIMGIYTKDPAVIWQGSSYLRVIALSYFLTAVTYSYSAILRSIEQVRLPMFVSLIALSLNTLLNFGLILGNFGLPALGVKGAAYATLIARLVETGLTVTLVYFRKLPLAARFQELFRWDRIPFMKFFRTTLPVILTEIIWSLGTTTYNAIYAHISTESIAAYNIAMTLDRLVFVIFIGLAHACAIMIGNQIGTGNTEAATIYGKKYMLIGLIGAAFSGLLIFLLKNPILSLYRVTPQTLDFANRILLVMIFSLPIRSLNLIVLIGILRSGGDTLYAMLIDAGIIWIIGVPMALLGAFILHLPVYLVYTLVMADEITKLLLGLRRFFQGRWAHTLTAPA